MSKRFLLEYLVKPTGKKGQFSYVADTEENARKQIVDRIADLEFVEKDEVELGRLLKIQGATKKYYECEGCT